MKKNNLNPLDAINQLKEAKPAETSDARVEHLIQKSEANTNAKQRTPLSNRVKFALIAAPALLAIVAVQGLNPNVTSPTLRLDLGEGSSTGINSSLGSWGAMADCAFRNRPCNDVGFGDVMMPAIGWNYTISPSINTEAPEGHVFSLSNFGGEKEIASRLADEFGIRTPIQKKIEGDGFESHIIYSAGTWEEENIYVQSSMNTTWIEYQDPAAKDWFFCQDSPNRKYSTRDCSTVSYEKVPTHSEATAYLQTFLDKLGLVSGKNLSVLKNGDYLIRVDEVDSALTASAHLVLNGLPTAGGLQFHWFNGSKDLAMIDGTLERAKDEGIFKTVNAETALNRMQKYITLPSLEKSFTPSVNTYEGMTMEERKRLYQNLLNSKGVEIDVALTRAEVGQVTIYDAAGRPWVVPGFHYFDDSGYVGSAFSLDGEYIQMDNGNK
ncbi:MAG: hypothetical protein EBS85_03190 [Micrococcales bacterium]|nr:hypothetical protein [Actinomycetota bacterium]NCA07718.1 hypothetical protein [Micrococcales bacterium]